MYITNSRGPSTLPCGTPKWTEGNVENVLSPVKTFATPPAHSPTSNSKEKIVDSPGGSVDTVIRSPPSYQKSKPSIKLSIPISQMAVDSQKDASENDSPTKSTAMPNKRRSALDRLNESSDSDIAFNDNSVPKEKSGADSEDDFDFFD
ncbi:hypothetical protein ACHWQZ_G018112 [Mnemiopsis leidyi]